MFLPRSLKADVYNEASILQLLCHSYVPLLIGVCVKQQPFSIVVQFYGFKGLEVSSIDKELMHNHFTGRMWILLATQLLEAIHYLHEEAKVLHNDIKCNILVAQSFTSSEESYQVMLIDFGKAIKISESKQYHLSDIEKLEHMRKYPHISPEVLELETIFSDMFSFVKVVSCY